MLNVFAATVHIWRSFPQFVSWAQAWPLWHGTHVMWKKIYVWFKVRMFLRYGTFLNFGYWWKTLRQYSDESFRGLNWAAIKFTSNLTHKPKVSARTFLLIDNARGIYPLLLQMDYKFTTKNRLLRLSGSFPTFMVYLSFFPTFQSLFRPSSSPPPANETQHPIWRI